MFVSMCVCVCFNVYGCVQLILALSSAKECLNLRTSVLFFFSEGNDYISLSSEHFLVLNINRVIEDSKFIAY